MRVVALAAVLVAVLVGLRAAGSRVACLEFVAENPPSVLLAIGGAMLGPSEQRRTAT